MPEVEETFVYEQVPTELAVGQLALANPLNDDEPELKLLFSAVHPAVASALLTPSENFMQTPSSSQTPKPRPKRSSAQEGRRTVANTRVNSPTKRMVIS